MDLILKKIRAKIFRSLDFDNKSKGDDYMKKNSGISAHMYNSDDVAELCGCSKNKAYNIIRALNHKLIASGTPKETTIAGKISKKYFHEYVKI